MRTEGFTDADRDIRKSSERISGHGAGEVLRSEREMQRLRDAWRIRGLLWGLIGTQREGLLGAVLRHPRQRVQARLGFWEVGGQSPCQEAGGLRRGSLPRAGGAPGSPLLPGRSISQTLFTELYRTDLSVKENCPKTYSYMA